MNLFFGTCQDKPGVILFVDIPKLNVTSVICNLFAEESCNVKRFLN